jgi:hypothetical protein
VRTKLFAESRRIRGATAGELHRYAEDLGKPNSSPAGIWFFLALGRTCCTICAISCGRPLDAAGHEDARAAARRLGPRAGTLVEVAVDLEHALDLAASVIAEMSDRPEIEAYLGELIRNASDGPRGRGSRFIPLTPLCSLRLEGEATVAERRH